MVKVLALVCLLACAAILATPCFAADSAASVQAEVSSVSTDQPVALTTAEMAAVTGEHGTVIMRSLSSPWTADLAVKLLGGWRNWRGAHVHVIVPLTWWTALNGGGSYNIAVLR